MAEAAENPITPTHFIGSTPDTAPGSDVGTFTPAQARTLLNVADGATANSTDAQLRDRTTHTGTQAESTITGLVTDLAGKAATSHTHVEADVTGLTAALALKAALASPSLTGTPLSTTAAPGTNTTQIATTAFVEARAQAVAAGLSFKDSVRAATTANGTLASAFDNASVIDGVTLVTGDRILVKNQSAPAENGLYTVPASGAPTRSADADTWTEIVSAFCLVDEGTANADTSWVCNVNAGGTINTTAVTFVPFAAASGPVDIAGLIEETTPDATADFLIIRDTSGSDNNKLLLDNIRTSMGAGATGFIQRTLKSKLGDYVNVLDFGAVADWNGTTGTDNTTAFTNAFATGKPIWFPKSSGTGMYWIGNIATQILKFVNPASHKFLSDGARLVCTTTASVRPYIFYCSLGSNWVFDGLEFQDTGFDIGIDFKGCNAITFGCDDADVTNVYVNCSFLNVVTPLQSLAGNNNLRNLRGQIYCVNTYYGTILETGTNVDLIIYHEGGRRGYFASAGQGSATGKIINHNIQLHVRNRATANGCCMIKNYNGTIDGVFVKVTTEGTNDGDSTLVRFEKENAGNPAARNIHIDISNVDDPTFITDVVFNNVTGSGVHSWENVKITGRSKFTLEALGSYLHDIIIDTDARTLRDCLEIASVGQAWALRCGNKVYKSRRNVQLSTNSISFDLRPLQPASLNVHYKVCIFAINNRTVLTAASVVAFEEHSVLAMLTATPTATLNIQTQMIAQFDTTDPACVISATGTSLLVTFPSYTGANGDAIVSLEPFA